MPSSSPSNPARAQPSHVPPPSALVVAAPRRPVSRLTSPSQLTVDARTRALFEKAVRAVSRGQLPTNVSILNDKMRVEDRTWHVLDETGGTFAMLCTWFEREGVIRTTRKGDSLVIT